LEEDTHVLDSIDKKGKYHEFRTLLRQFNVSRRENAFEVLVNLFLCKIVDERKNPNDLKFYWKGIAYQNYFDFVDDLQDLYQIGMREFLEQEVVYIGNEEIDKAFWVVKNNKNRTKDRIKDLFRQLKFYKGLDFGFIKVQNKEQFEKNAKILLAIVEMWQGIRLTSKGQNQFLGDMFEYFLDNGVKQTEGQFFTPMPICKFILQSLPVEAYVQQKKEPLKAIDYACGAGHFLTEFALQVTPHVEKHTQIPVAEYYKNIYGIEKEDRLALVSKILAYMHGYKEIKIVETDALGLHPDLKEQGYDFLVANPPFAVEDFLRTLDEDKDHTRYKLFETVNDLGNKNIQCFFLERAKQLLAPNGVAGIIVPSSVLANSDVTHVRTREILLQYFDFVAIVELGSNTFGKTGTNTVVLFLRRKAENPEQAKHFLDRAEAFFENGKEEVETNGGIYQDLPTLKQYAQHIDIPFEVYQQLLINLPPSPSILEGGNNALPKMEKVNISPLQNGEGAGKEVHTKASIWDFEIFKEYKNAFDKSTDTQNIKEKHRKQLQNLPKAIEKELKQSYKDAKQTPTEAEIKASLKQVLPTREQAMREAQQAELTQKLWDFVRAIEQDKFYYFLLALHNPTKTLIVKSPTDNAEQKRFLGYEWSEAKNNEGIKYYGGDTVHEVTTPMFNPRDVQDASKINYYIQQNFLQQTPALPTELQPFVSYANLTDLLDFTRKDFNKALSLSFSSKKIITIETKWELIKLGDIAEIQSGGTPSSEKPEYWSGDVNWATLVDTKNKYLYSTQRKITKEGLKNSSAKLLPINTVIFSSRATIGDVTIAKVETATNQGYKNFICNESKIMHEFLYEMLKRYASDIASLASGMTFKEISKTEIANFKIPLPPLDVQARIVGEIEELEKNKQQYLTEGVTMKDFERIIKEKKNEIIKKYL
jgi:type I restriction-modification system DNA methylase subunit